MPSRRHASLKLLLLLFPAACLRVALASESRKLLQKNDKLLSGTFIQIDVSYPDGRSEQHLAIRKPNGKRVKLQLPDQAMAAQLRSGAKVQASGRWVTLAGLHVEDDSGSEPTRFVATDLQDTSTKTAPPEPIVRQWQEPTGPLPNWDHELVEPTAGPQRRLQGQEEQGLDGARGGAGVEAPRGRRLAQATPPEPITITLPRQITSVRTLFVPIVARQGGTSSGYLCPNTGINPLNTTGVRNVAFSENNPDGPTVSTMFNDCSFNNTKITATNSAVANLVVLPCSGSMYGIPWSFNTCSFDDFNGYADAADQVLWTRGVDLSLYPYRVYMLPPNACDWLGMGYIGCDGTYDCRAWVTGSVWDKPMVIAHELGHNLYLSHSGANVNNVFDEYADMSGVMGGCGAACEPRCPNMAKSWQLGWHTLRQFNQDNLPIGFWYNTSIAGQTLSQTIQPGFRIIPDWTTGLKPIFVSYRVRARGDEFSANGVWNRVHVHTSGVSNNKDAVTSIWRTSLSVEQSWTYLSANLVIRRRLSNFASYAVVQLCRRGSAAETQYSCLNNIDWNCDGFSGADDASCIPWIPGAGGSRK